MPLLPIEARQVPSSIMMAASGHPCGLRRGRYDHTRTVLSQLADASRPSGSTARACTLLVCPSRVDEVVPVSGVYGPAPAEARADTTADRPPITAAAMAVPPNASRCSSGAPFDSSSDTRQATEVARGHQARPPAPAVRGRGPAPTAGECRAKQLVVAPRGGAERQHSVRLLDVSHLTHEAEGLVRDLAVRAGLVYFHPLRGRVHSALEQNRSPRVALGTRDHAG